jgi:hypothetical protein
VVSHKRCYLFIRAHLRRYKEKPVCWHQPVSCVCVWKQIEER